MDYKDAFYALGNSIEVYGDKARTESNWKKYEQLCIQLDNGYCGYYVAYTELKSISKKNKKRLNKVPG